MVLPLSLDDLRHAVSDGQRFDYVFFHGHKPDPDGGLGHGCFSQWWPSAFEVDGIRYSTAEQFMMAEKARLFDDHVVLEEILRAAPPAEAKSLGRSVRDFDESVWSEHRFDIVVQGNVAKFGQDPALREHLLGTHPCVLAEASPRDRTWGIGMSASNVHARDPLSWRGLNLLGFALVAAREELRRGLTG